MVLDKTDEITTDLVMFSSVATRFLGNNFILQNDEQPSITKNGEQSINSMTICCYS